MSDEEKHVEPVWGFWISVKDHASAHYAAKMSGLPVFMLGVSCSMISLLFLLQQLWSLAGIMLLSAVFFLVTSLKIRKGQFTLLPFAVGAWLILLVLEIVTADFTFVTVVNLLIGLLAVSGLRGWWWLRKDKQT